MKTNYLEGLNKTIKGLNEYLTRDYDKVAIEVSGMIKSMDMTHSDTMYCLDSRGLPYYETISANDNWYDISGDENFISLSSKRAVVITFDDNNIVEIAPTAETEFYILNLSEGTEVTFKNNTTKEYTTRIAGEDFPANEFVACIPSVYGFISLED